MLEPEILLWFFPKMTVPRTLLIDQSTMPNPALWSGPHNKCWSHKTKLLILVNERYLQQVLEE